MATSLDPQAEKLRRIHTIPALVTYLHDELGWPVDVDDWEDAVYDWQPQELNLKPEHAVAIKSIKQLRPLVTGRPRAQRVPRQTTTPCACASSSASASAVCTVPLPVPATTSPRKGGISPPGAASRLRTRSKLFLTFSLRIMLARCTSTVRGEQASALAISLLVKPFTR